MRSVTLIAAAVCAGLPAAAQNAVVPAGFRGHWASTQAGCMRYDESRLTVSADVFEFYESRGKVLSARQVARQEVEFEMESTGEGQTWRSVRRFALSPDGLTLTDVTGREPFVRVRCEQVPLPFTDEAPRAPDFLEFRARLLDAVASRDAAFVLSIVAENILSSFGGDGGIEEFTTTWRLESADSPFWAELDTVLRLGGAFQGQYFVAPYTFATWPSSVDSFEHVAVIGENVNVRAEPSLAAAVVSQMSYQTVRRERGGRRGDWIAVRLADGGTGFIDERYARSPIDYRARFERRNGKWVMVSFAAGD